MIIRTLSFTERIFNCHLRKKKFVNLSKSRTLLIPVQNTTVPVISSPFASHSTSKAAEADDKVNDISKEVE